MNLLSYPEFRREFPAAERLIYFDSATVALGSKRVGDAYKDAIDRWLDGSFAWWEGIEAGNDCRTLLARMIGAKTKEVSLQPSVSAGSGLIALQFPEARSGENIVVAEQEFSSNFLPWTSLQLKGYEIRFTQVGQNSPSLEEFDALTDSRTRLIAVSGAQSATGHLADRAGLAELAHKNGACLFVDGAQCAGAVPIDVEKEGVDFMAIPSYKFMLGTRGMGYLYVREEHLEEFGPLSPNWLSTQDPARQFYGPELPLSETASRLDGPTAWFAALGEQQSLRLFFDYDRERIFNLNADLTDRLLQGLVEKGYPLEERLAASQRSTIVSVEVADAEQLRLQFEEAGVKAAVRANGVRLALHGYNTSDEVDRVLTLMPDAD